MIVFYNQRTMLSVREDYYLSLKFGGVTFGLEACNLKLSGSGPIGPKSNPGKDEKNA